MRALLEAGKKPEALEEVQALAAGLADRPAFWRSMGRFFLEAGDLEHGSEYIARAGGLAPDHGLGLDQIMVSEPRLIGNPATCMELALMTEWLSRCDAQRAYEVVERLRANPSREAMEALIWAVKLKELGPVAAALLAQRAWMDLELPAGFDAAEYGRIHGRLTAWWQRERRL